MATASAAGGAHSPDRGAGMHDRLFYGGMAIAMGLTVFAGFSATYYLRLLAGGPKATLTGGPFTPLVHLHGALFTAWVLLFIVQTALVASHRVAVHRRLGVAGAGLAAAMVVVGTLMFACALVPLWALALGQLRGIPLWWRAIDASFGIVGFVPAFLCHRWTRALEKGQQG